MREIIRDALGDAVVLKRISTSKTMVRFELTKTEWPAMLSYTTEKAIWLGMSREAKIETLQVVVEKKLLEAGISV